MGPERHGLDLYVPKSSWARSVSCLPEPVLSLQQRRRFGSCKSGNAHALVLRTSRVRARMIKRAAHTPGYLEQCARSGGGRGPDQFEATYNLARIRGKVGDRAGRDASYAPDLPTWFAWFRYPTRSMVLPFGRAGSD
jgi:hypothetical protein